MAVINIQRRARELGRIRLGHKGAKGQPVRLDAFRLTSPDRTLLEAAAARYGGQVQPWEGQPGQFELYTEASELPCLIAPQEVTQWYELWDRGGCQRRCDGENCTLAGKNGTVDTKPCLCDPEKRECKLTTRLSVMLHELPGVGTWRLESHGYYAATELPASAEILIGMARGGHFPPAAVAIEQRTVTRDGQTKRFPVPVIRIRQALGTLMTGEIIDVPALPSGAPALPAGGPESSGDRQALQEPQAPPTSAGRERATQAMASAEQSASYAAQTGAGNGNGAVDLNALKNRCTEHLKSLGRTTKGSREYFGAILGVELPPLKDCNDPEQWTRLEQELRDATKAKTRSYAVWGEICKLDGMDAQDRAQRLDAFAVLLGLATLGSSADLTPAQWQTLAGKLSEQLEKTREIHRQAETASDDVQEAEIVPEPEAPPAEPKKTFWEAPPAPEPVATAAAPAAPAATGNLYGDHDDPFMD